MGLVALGPAAVLVALVTDAEHASVPIIAVFLVVWPGRCDPLLDDRPVPAEYRAGVPTPPADWYPDPEQPARLRYWDGAQWTGYLVDPDRPGVVRYERPAWTTTGQAAGINVPLSIAVTSAF